MTNDIKWIKLTVDMFDNRKIRHIRKLPEGNNIVLIWVMLLTMAGRCNSNGFIFLTENIPYTEKMFADELGFEESVIHIALNVLEKFNMVHRDGDFLSVPGWEEYQNIEVLERIREQSRKRMEDYRARKREGVTSVGQNCVYCGKPANTVDHLIPKIKGGPDKNWNLVPCCKNCNSIKRDKDLADFLNDSFIYGHQNINHDLVRNNEKIMKIVDFEDGKYSQKDMLRNSYGDVTGQKENKNIDLDKDIIIVSKDTICQTDVRQIMEEWNKLSKFGIKQVSRLNKSSKRFEMLVARIKQYGKDDILTAIEKIKQSDYCQGKNKYNWAITFDWFVRPNNFPKVLDGNYDNRSGGINDGQPNRTTKTYNDRIIPEGINNDQQGDDLF